MTTIAARPRIVGCDLTVEGSEEVFRGKIVDVAQVRSPSRLFPRTYHVFTIDGTRADGGDEIASVLMFDDTTPIRSLLLAFPDLYVGIQLVVARLAIVIAENDRATYVFDCRRSHSRRMLTRDRRNNGKGNKNETGTHRLRLFMGAQVTTSTETLIMLLSEYDGAHGEIVRAWLSNVYATTIGHGWALGRDIRVSDNMARGERILRALEDYAFIKRVKMDLSYAPEIRHFGVGGFSGNSVYKSDSPLLFTFEPTDRLRAFMQYVRDQGK